MVVAKAHVEQVYSRLVRLVGQHVFALALLVALQVRSVRTLDGERQRSQTYTKVYTVFQFR